MKKFIINIQQIKEGRKTYYLATTEEIKGFLVEGDTIDEVVERVPQVLSAILQARAERLKKEQTRSEVMKKIKDISYSGAWVFNAQTAYA